MSSFTKFLNEHQDPAAVEKLIGKSSPADGPMEKLKQIKVLLANKLITQAEYDEWRITILATL
jgi:hypothetical protein